MRRCTRLMMMFCSFRPIEGNPSKSSILDSMQWILDSRYWIPDSLSVELGVRILIAAGFRIPAAEFRIPRVNFQIPRAKDFPDSGIWITLHS